MRTLLLSLFAAGFLLISDATFAQSGCPNNTQQQLDEQRRRIDEINRQQRDMARQQEEDWNDRDCDRNDFDGGCLLEPGCLIVELVCGLVAIIRAEHSNQ